jgi:hypothetical protein
MRLIVLSKTHAWGRICRLAVRKAEQAPTHALCALMSSRVRPSNSRGSRTDPSIHDVIQPTRARGSVGNLIFRDRMCAWFLVEPDGIEPTTSCLQSTRSTN